MSTTLAPMTVAPHCNYPLRSEPPTANKHILRWVERISRLVEPDRVHWVDGSAEEAAALEKLHWPKGKK